jgi:hypothetical protein
MNIRLNINGKWKWEWIDTASGKTVQDLVNLVDAKIKGHPMLSVRKLKKELLPFKNYYSKTPIKKDTLDYDPDRYLEPNEAS